MLQLAREVEKIVAEKKVTLNWLTNSNQVKPEKYNHLHLDYDFTITLISKHSTIKRMVFTEVLNFKYISKIQKIKKTS